jgi:hypothetical protein
MLIIYSGFVEGMPGKYLGYVGGDGCVFRGGIHGEGGIYLGYVGKNGYVYRGGRGGEGGKYIGSARWDGMGCQVYKGNNELDDEEKWIGRVTSNGILYGGGYILPETAKFKGYATGYVQNNIDDVRRCGAVVLLLFSDD